MVDGPKPNNPITHYLISKLTHRYCEQVLKVENTESTQLLFLLLLEPITTSALRERYKNMSR